MVTAAQKPEAGEAPTDYDIGWVSGQHKYRLCVREHIVRSGVIQPSDFHDATVADLAAAGFVSASSLTAAQERVARLSAMHDDLMRDNNELSSKVVEQAGQLVAEREGRERLREILSRVHMWRGSGLPSGLWKDIAEELNGPAEPTPAPPSEGPALKPYWVIEDTRLAQPTYLADREAETWTTDIHKAERYEAACRLCGEPRPDNINHIWACCGDGPGYGDAIKPEKLACVERQLAAERAGRERLEAGVGALLEADDAYSNGSGDGTVVGKAIDALRDRVSTPSPPSEANTLNVMRVADGKVVASEVHHGGAGGGDEDGYDMTGLNGGPTHRDVRNWVHATSERDFGRAVFNSLLRYVDRCEQAERASPVECRCRRAAMGSTRCEECEHDLSCPCHMAHKEGPASPVAEGETERVAERVHDNWVQMKLATGVTSRLSESGEELMRPYAQLSEAAKEMDRGTVSAVLDALRSQPTPTCSTCGGSGEICDVGAQGGPTVPCPDCADVRAALNGIRSQPTPTGEAKDSAIAQDAVFKDHERDGGESCDVAPVVENTGHLSSPVAPAAEGELCDCGHPDSDHHSHEFQDGYCGRCSCARFQPPPASPPASDADGEKRFAVGQRVRIVRGWTGPRSIAEVRVNAIVTKSGDTLTVGDGSFEWCVIAENCEPLETAPPQPPPLGQGPTEALRMVAAAARRASHRGYIRDDGQNALQALADELAKGAKP